MEELISKRKIDSTVKKLGKAIAADYKGEAPVFIGILKGSFIFMADLIRAANIDCEVDFILQIEKGRYSKMQGVRLGFKFTDGLEFEEQGIIIED